MDTSPETLFDTVAGQPPPPSERPPDDAAASGAARGAALRGDRGPGRQARRHAGDLAEPAADSLAEPVVEVRRSPRRTRTVSAYRDHTSNAIIVLVPARLSRTQQDHWVRTMVERVLRSERRRRPSDTELLERADRLSARYLDGRAKPASVTWVDNQHSRWGSCTMADRTIRISSRVRGLPGYVLDYVLLHELTHLLVPAHDADFWAWLARYPQTERARGFLEGVSTGVAQAAAGAGTAEPDLTDVTGATGELDDAGALDDDRAGTCD